MPIVDIKSDLYRDAHLLEPSVDPLKSKGRAIYMTGTVENAATDSTGSKYRLAELPADCYLHEDTFFDVENDGFAQIVIGTNSDTDALLDVARSAAAIQQPVAIGDANHGKQLWEILGMAENPGGYITLFKHAEANATAAGSMPFRIVYIWR